jgi:hypothetical protein
MNKFSLIQNIFLLPVLRATARLISYLLHFELLHFLFRSQDIPVDIATGYGLDGQGSISGRGKRFFSTPQHPGQLRGPPSLLSNWYWGCWEKKVTTSLVPRSQMVELQLHSSICLHGDCLIN